MGMLEETGENCWCLALVPMTAIASTCRNAGGCPEHPKDSPPRGGAEGVHVHEWSEFQQGSTLYPRALQVEYAHCDCGASKARRAELEKPQEPVCGHLNAHCNGARFSAAGGKRFYSCPDCGAKYTETVPVCTHCQGPHALEDCKGLEEPEEGVCVCGHPEGDHRAGLSQPYNGCNWCKLEQCGGYRTEPEEGTPGPCGRCPHPSDEHSVYGCADDCACEWMPKAAPPHRPPYAVAYAVEGGALYEVAVPGDATVVAEDGVLQVLHPKRPVLAIVRITPVNMEENDG